MAIQVEAFTQGVNVPSSRFRIRQYIPQLAEAGVQLTECPAPYGSYPLGPGLGRLPWLAKTTTERCIAAFRANNKNLVIFQREMVSTLCLPELFCKAPAVLDVDDAVWLTQRFGSVDRLAARSRLVICGNEYIADHFARFAPVRVLPTGVDTARWTPGTRAVRPTIVWSGSCGNLGYLYEIEAALRRVLDAVPDSRLRIVCDRAPELAELDRDKVEYVPWSEGAEVAAVQSAWVGLMPMPDSPWTRGKCSFKLLTYLACAVPGVAAPWGMNSEVIAAGGALAARSEREWFEAIVYLLENPSEARRVGLAGRAQVEQRYASTRIGGLLAATLVDVANKS